MKTILKFTGSLLLAAALVLLISPHYDNGLQSSHYAKPYSATVRRAIVKSGHWANDREILKLVNRAERQYGRQIDHVAKKYSACPKDVTAIAIVESSVEASAKSSEGAIGLMGVKRTTGSAMGFADIEHPLANLSAGTKYYKTLLKRFKDRELAFAAYNIGPTRVENWLDQGFDPETMAYIWKIRRVVHVIDRSASNPQFD